ncbi:AsnC family transcriptional regulator [Tateyamaria sp.]|uniref:AsnC family transcriptional regulator n=1 Tax=Tateyamaria sp. TaxID=1929288 RepID=UPI00329CD3A3
MLNHIDLAILRILQKDNSLTHRWIGEQVNLSALSVQRRIKRFVSASFIIM